MYIINIIYIKKGYLQLKEKTCNLLNSIFLDLYVIFVIKFIMGH